jgi:hypothetical protein
MSALLMAMLTAEASNFLTGAMSILPELCCHRPFGDCDIACVDMSPVLEHMVEILPDTAVMRGFFDAVPTSSEG